MLREDTPTFLSFYCGFFLSGSGGPTTKKKTFFMCFFPIIARLKEWNYKILKEKKTFFFFFDLEYIKHLIQLISYKRYLECTLIQWILSIYPQCTQVAEGTFFMKSPVAGKQKTSLNGSTKNGKNMGRER